SAAGALFLSRTGSRLASQDVRRICQRIAQDADEVYRPWKTGDVTPRILRNTYLMEVATEYGIDVAYQVSGTGWGRGLEKFIGKVPTAKQKRKQQERQKRLGEGTDMPEGWT